MPSTLDKVVSRTRLSFTQFTVVVAVALVLLAFGAAYLDGLLGEVLTTDLWRNLFAYPALITYILAIYQPMGRISDDALEAFRPLMSLDDVSFDELIHRVAGVNPRKEILAFIIGAVVALVTTSPWRMEGGLSWVAWYFAFTSSLTLGLLGWVIYIALDGTAASHTLTRYPLNVDVFDLQAFEPVARSALVSALAFFGGGIISLFFFYPWHSVFDVETLVTYGILVVISVVVFFLPLRHTHRVLAQTKARELASVQQSIVAAYRSLDAFPDVDLGATSTAINLWKEYEQRLKGAKTWPYNLGMVRTFLFSVLTPVAISAAQRLLSQFFS
jgi:hypothetical protein